jgi:nicotinate-nucleotide adenylyltransferase
MRLGILGGSFNPVHLGHLHIAEGAQRVLGLAQVHFVVATFPPHKRLEHLIPFTHRYAMVSLATSRFPSFIPSLMELVPPASPFSIDTLAKFARIRNRNRQGLYFVAGTDSLLDVANWRDSEELLLSYNFVFISRPGVEIGEACAALPSKAIPRVLDLRECGPRQTRRRIESAASGSETHVFILDLEAPDISASRIRELVASGRRFEHLVPAPVRAYIQKLTLYGAQCQTR